MNNKLIYADLVKPGKNRQWTVKRFSENKDAHLCLKVLNVSLPFTLCLPQKNCYS